ncbi:aryl-alcohol dehydrogenase [Pisolithus orientalis]|uniref:aryl-alcohol dehydrogenase n=1 Tax=Pisolithus orientalis TaxID=936130 RepID=UPI0022251724|nr:aryl-alcohol dehydrogenase [Pisolithus orientalis]KAI5986758.1 aryl-alcohol dehydrogenase [Pisolithus orientalis]
MSAQANSSAVSEATVATAKNMPYVRLGNSGLKVSKIILGTMQYGSKAWQDWVLDEEEAIEHIRVAYEAGIQTFDTANVYSNGHCEIVLGKAIKHLNLPREEIVVMTKCFFVVAKEEATGLLQPRDNPDQKGYVNQHGLSRKHIFDSVKASLRRLQLDYIDVLQCHRFDPETPIEETMQALHDVVKAGYARYIGMSSCYAYQFHAMQSESAMIKFSKSCRDAIELLTKNDVDYAITNRLTPFISMQNHYNMLYREEEREMFPTLKMLGVGAIPWSPLARGLLTRPLGEETTRSQTDFRVQLYKASPARDTIINRVEELAEKKGVSMAQISIAWMLSKDHVTAPIVGTTSLDNLKDIIAAVHLKLTPEEIQDLEKEYRPSAILGHA